ncbi:MAG: hemolysin, partial [Eubacterium sp.]|nr:hemolysin [Eubacterium sp.]
DTLAGFVINKLGYLPSDDDTATVEYENLTITVIEVTDRRIEKLKVKINNS